MNKYCRLADDNSVSKAPIDNSVSKAPIDNSVGKAPIVKMAVRKAQRAIEKLL